MAVDAFRVDLPESWTTVPVDAAALEETLVRIQKSEEWHLLPKIEQRRVELFFRRFLEDAKSADVRFASVFMEVVSGAATDGEAGGEGSGSDESAADGDLDALLASCTVSMLDRASLAVALPLTAEVVQAAMSLDSATGNATQLEPPAVVELPCGKAVRLLRLVASEAGARVPFKCFVETYMIPVPPEHDRVLIVQFATPNIDDSRAFSELFAAIADNVKMYEADEPTTI